MKKPSQEPKVSKQSKAITAYETIVKKIICLEYQPSQHLEENQLVEDLGIGRTPIREALLRLHGERMVESHPKKGVIVRPITLQNTKAMFESMKIIEFGVVDVAINKDCSIFIDKMNDANKRVIKAVKTNDAFELVEANHDFHMNFAKCSQNEFLIRADYDVRSEAKRLSYLSYDNIIDPDKPLETHYESVMHEHELMIDYLLKKDAEKLKNLIEEHILTFRQRIIIFMTS